MILEDTQCGGLALELSKRVFVYDLRITGIVEDGGGDPGLKYAS